MLVSLNPLWITVYLAKSESLSYVLYKVMEALLFSCKSYLHKIIISNVWLGSEYTSASLIALHKKWSFPFKISSVNVTKSAVSCVFAHIYWRNSEWETSFFVQWEREGLILLLQENVYIKTVKRYFLFFGTMNFAVAKFLFLK